jgi:hypothetical protein
MKWEPPSQQCDSAGMLSLRHDGTEIEKGNVPQHHYPEFFVEHVTQFLKG